MMNVRLNVLPSISPRDTQSASKLANDREFLCLGEIVTDVVPENTAVFFCARVFYEKCNRNWSAATATKNLAALFTRGFARSSLIAAKMEDVDAAKLFR